MNNNTKNKVITILFSLTLLFFFVANILTKDEDISISERRKLQQFPKLTINNLLSGSFFKDFDQYTTDQFIKRDEFRKLKVNIELKTKHNYNNLYTYNDYIIEQTYPLNEKSVISLTNKMNLLKTNYFKNNNIYYTIVPDKNYFVNSNNLKLDYNKLTNIMNQNLQDFTYIDIFNLLSLDDYYKTDTHWKQENLSKIANAIAHTMNIDITNNYIEKDIINFKGVYAYRLPIKTDNDTIKVLTNEIIENALTYNYETKKEAPIYNLDKINSLDKYDIYLSGAVSIIDITNNNSTNDKELIVFRDSFGSSLIPLLISGYSKITVIDTRYVSPKILTNYVDFNNKDVLFIYSAISINNSGSIR